MLQLLVALQFYTTRCFQMVDRDLFGIHKSTVSRIVGSVSVELTRLKNQYIRFESTGETAAGFYRRAGFPGVLGAIDCTHIQLCSLLERGQYEGHLLGDNFYPCRSYLMNPPNTSREVIQHQPHCSQMSLGEGVWSLEEKIPLPSGWAPHKT